MFDTRFVLTQNLIQVGRIVLLVGPHEPKSGLLNFVIQLCGFDATRFFALPCFKHMENGRGQGRFAI